MAKKQPTLDELNEQIAAKENRLREMQTWAKRWSFGESGVRGDIQRLIEKRDKLYPVHNVAPGTIPNRLRAWRGQRGVREVVPILSDAIGDDVSIGVFCAIEGGWLGNVEPELLSKIEEFLRREN